MRVPLLLFSLEQAQTLGTRFRGLGVKVYSLYPGLRYDLVNADLDIAPERYSATSFLSAVIWGLVFGFLGRLVATLRAMEEPQGFLLSFGLFVGGTLVFLVLHMIYPKIIAGKVAAGVDRELVFAARDLLIQISSGIPLYTAIANVADADYGQVSEEFRVLVREVRSGKSIVEAIENMAVRTKSIYLKKTAWQLVTAIRSGANLEAALKGIVKLLMDYQFSLNKSYSAELNFIILIYLLTAAVLPTVGVTVLVIFSVFGMLSINEAVFAGIIGISFAVQAAIIGYLYTKRPAIYS
jgi:flagellar protein FlaJ